MKKKLSLYWWCQFGLWSVFILTSTIFYFALPAFTTYNFYPATFLHVTIGVFITHLMRLFIIKAKLLELNVFKKIIYLIPVTIFFSFFTSVISVSLNKIFNWENPLFGARTFGTQILVISSFSSFPFLGIWNLVYFIYHYVEKSRMQQIDKIRLENELKVQQLESEKAKAEMQREATELQIKAMVTKQEEERKRISRDLHDDVGTKLSALNLYLSSLSEKATAINNNEIRSLAQSSKQFIKEAMFDVRQLLLNLSPTVLEEFGYTTAVEGLVNKINETKQIHFDLVVFGINHRLKKDYELALYRITQELINNVLKHAEAKHVSLQIGQRDEKIILMMEDNGKGFDVSAHKDGYGLHNLDARTKLMQGTMTIDSQPGKGTSVLIEIPYNYNGV